MTSLAFALVSTIACAGVMFALTRFHVPSAVFNFNVDVLDPRNYRAGGRWLILPAIALSIATLVAWVRVIGG